MGCSGYPRCDFVESIDLNVERIERQLQTAQSDVDYLKSLVRELEQKLDKGDQA